MQQMLKVKKGIVVLPKTFQKSWTDVEVFARVSSDTVVLKKIQPSSFWETWEKIKQIKPRVSKKDVDKAITWARTSS